MILRFYQDIKGYYWLTKCIEELSDTSEEFALPPYFSAANGDTKPYGVYNYAFSGTEKIKKIIIPSTIEYIGSRICYRSNIVQIEFSSTLPPIVQQTSFDGANVFDTSITYKEANYSLLQVVCYKGLVDRYRTAFSSCAAVKESKVEFIDNGIPLAEGNLPDLFEAAEALTAIQINNGVTSIGKMPFAGAYQRDPEVDDIGDNIYIDTTGNSLYHVNNESNKGQILYSNISSHSGILGSTQGAVITDPITSNVWDSALFDATITSDDNILNIAADNIIIRPLAFQHVHDIKKIHFNTANITIFPNSFYGINKNELVEISNTGTFADNTYGIVVKIAEGRTIYYLVDYIHKTILTYTAISMNNSFYSWNNLESVVAQLFPQDDQIGDHMIPKYMCQGDLALKTVVIPATETFMWKGIDNYTFADCANLNSFIFGNDNQKDCIINSGAFLNCSSLTAAKITAHNTIIEEKAFDNCLNLTTFEIVAPNGDKNSKIVIKKDAFSKCSKLQTIKLPKYQVKDIDGNIVEAGADITIEDGAFSLETVSIVYVT